MEDKPHQNCTIEVRLVDNKISCLIEGNKRDLIHVLALMFEQDEQSNALKTLVQDALIMSLNKQRFESLEKEKPKVELVN